MESEEQVKIRGLESFLAREANVQAVLYDLERNKLSLATIGPFDEELLKSHLAEALTAIEVEFESLGQPAKERLFPKIRAIPSLVEQ